MLYFFIGGCELQFDSKYKELFLNVSMCHRLIYRDLVVSDDKRKVHITCTLHTAQLFLSVCSRTEINIEVTKCFGLPFILKKYRKRYGLLVGMLLCVLLVFQSREYLWDIRVSGCINTAENEVVDILSSHGLRVGCKISSLDIDSVENTVLIESDQISWIAVNIKGNVAMVEIRESLPVPVPESNSPANLIAKCDGQIEDIFVNKGNTLIHTGQVVRKGDILVSGIYDSLPWGYRYTRANGIVTARTFHTLKVTVPLKYKKKVYSGESEIKKSIVFFTKEIKLYRNTRFLGATYDTIYNEDNILRLPDGTRLPFEINKVTHVGYKYDDCIRSEIDAIDAAYLELDEKIDEIISEGATLLKKNITGYLCDDAYILDCELTLIENIAEIIEFEVVDQFLEE